jgi:hypothetical protein
VATHDARTLENANVNTVIECQHEFLMAGDLGYPISDVLIKSYPNREDLVDHRKAEFNTRLSRDQDGIHREHFQHREE